MNDNEGHFLLKALLRTHVSNMCVILRLTSSISRSLNAQHVDYLVRSHLIDVVDSLARRYDIEEVSTSSPEERSSGLADLGCKRPVD